MTIDTRVLERRREVAEEQAKRSLGRLVRLLAVAVPVAVLAWVALSPWLSVSHVDIEGAKAAAVYEVLNEHGIVVGTPMILLRPEEAKAALESDPWVAQATISLLWPDRVSVSLVERAPLAWVQTAEGWSRRARDSVALPSADVPDAGLASIALPEIGAGEAMGSPELAGALEWVEALPSRLRPGTVVRMVDGELWAEVETHLVRLGRAVDMTAKAKTVAALLGQGLAPGTEINVVAPSHPATSVPEPADHSEQP